MSKKFNELDEYEKIDKVGQTALEVTSSIGMTFAVFSALTVMTGFNEYAHFLPVLTGASLITSPFTYLGMKHLQKKFDERMKRDENMAAQLFTMMDEAFCGDRKITSTSSFFVQEILDVFEEKNKDFPQDEIMHINQFLYLINANYYDEIHKQFPSIDREDLIRKIVEQISNYLNISNRLAFDEEDAKKVLDYCIFINRDLKEQIFKEFKKSKVKLLETYDYQIIRKDTETMADYIAKFNQEKDATWFDADDIKHYEAIIANYEKQEYWQEEGYPSPENLKWDLEFLRTIIKTIIRDHRQELRKTNSEYTNLNLAGNYIFNAMAYAVLNNKKEVGQTELLNTFKNWNYLPFEMKLDTINTIFDENEISYDEHPLGIKKSKDKKPTQKIITFPKNIKQESE